MFELPELPYAYNALEPYIDEVTMKLHHDKHHATYITNLNDALKDTPDFYNMTLEELMTAINDVPEAVRIKVRNNGGGHVNHSFFWKIMASPAAGGQGSQPTGAVADAINASFGDFAKFQEAFEKAGIGRFGSGWAWLIVEEGKLKIMDTPNQDNPWMEGKKPILGCDVWEHAYYLKYQNKRADYLKAWWNVVNWTEVTRLYGEAMK
jgi:Fe-Mn family superoxide dismutase